MSSLLCRVRLGPRDVKWFARGHVSRKRQGALEAAHIPPIPGGPLCSPLHLSCFLGSGGLLPKDSDLHLTEIWTDLQAEPSFPPLTHQIIPRRPSGYSSGSPGTSFFLLSDRVGFKRLKRGARGEPLGESPNASPPCLFPHHQIRRLE